MGLFKSKSWLVMLLALFLTACQNLPLAHPNEIIACPDQRPEICTMHYQPVCGFDDSAQVMKTYGNACGACNDARVMGYVHGACKQ